MSWTAEFHIQGLELGERTGYQTLSKTLPVEDQGASRAGSPEPSPGLLLTRLLVILILFCL